jgi:hypothetical protein
LLNITKEDYIKKIAKAKVGVWLASEEVAFSRKIKKK